MKLKKLKLLTSSPPLENNPTTLSLAKGQQMTYVFIAVYVICSLVYGFLSNSPWDDDCVTRYYHTKVALQDPSMFFSLWNRPLFVLLFFPAAQIGPWAMMVQMIGITAISGYFLFKGVQKLQVGYAPLVLPFFFFQTYFFSVSRNNLTEPLAVAIICLGFYFLTHKKYLWFAVVGSLLPLARLELSVLLAVWGLILILEKKWQYLAILPIPVLLLNVLGAPFHDGNLKWIADATLGKEDEENRYGHTEFWHYFKRYIFVTGPVVFYFFFIGLFERIRRCRVDLFIFVQFILGFMLYVVFSWKLNMGNAAGFLRNLIPLTPMVAVLALFGFNYWARVFDTVLGKTGDIKEDTLNETSLQPVKETKHKKKTRKQLNDEANKKALKKKAARQLKRASNLYTLDAVLVYLLTVIVVGITFLHYSHSIKMHHKLLDDVNYTNLYIIGACAGLLLLLTPLKRFMAAKAWLPILLGTIILLGATSYTMISEPPDAHQSEEREVLDLLAEIYMDSYLKEQSPLYTNHLWLFWTSGLSYPNEEKYKALTKANLDSAPANSLVIWESHYSHRLFGDVRSEYLEKNKEYVELCRLITPENKFNVAVFHKLDSNTTALEVQNRFIATFPNKPWGYTSRAKTHLIAKRYDDALADLYKSLEMDTTAIFTYFSLGTVYFNMKDYEMAIASFKKLADSLPTYYHAHYNTAAAYVNAKKFKEAIPYLKRVIQTKKDYWQAYRLIASAYSSLGDLDKANSYYNILAANQPKDYDCFLNRGNNYFQQKKFKAALADFDHCIQLRPKSGTAYYNKGLTLANMNDMDEACKMMLQAAKLGHKQSVRALSICK